ncbi:MAG: GNAT family N-acetyltransferase [Acidimicrobiales bacterium]
MPTPERPSDVEVRRATDDDLPAVLELAQASLGWRPDDPNDAFFRWKHLENPAGRSPMWVAVADGHLVGFRVFLRWRFVDGDGHVHTAVRAVDTATHPDHQGRGIFRRLTLGAVDELQAEGVDFVFNTPNTQSRPGYLKMGWQVVGRVPIAVRPRSPRAAYRMARARTAAGKWSRATTAGVAAGDALSDDEALASLLTSLDRPKGLATDRTAEHLRWRYRFGPLAYRAVVAPGGPAEGLAVFRVRDRGAATEAVLCEVLVPGGDRRLGADLVREVARSTAADYVIGTTRTGVPRTALPVPMVRQGPVLTWRAVDPAEQMPPLADWALTMGDVELF